MHIFKTTRLFATSARKNLRAKHVTGRSSPLSLKVIFEQVKRGGGDTSLQECLDDEFSVNTHLFGLPDFEMAMQARDAGVSSDLTGKRMKDNLFQEICFQRYRVV